MKHSLTIAPVTLGVLLALGSMGCEKDVAAPEQLHQPSDGLPFEIPAFETVPANPDGVTLSGPGDARAVVATRWMPPSPTAPTNIGSDGLLRDQLEAAINPDATVDQVNDALASIEGAILSMSGGSPFVTLRVPLAADHGEAQARADALLAGDAFTYAAPAYGASRKRVQGREDPPNDAGESWHTDAMNLWAGWNLASGVDSNDRTVIITADYYPHETGVPGIGDNLVFFPGGGVPIPTSEPEANSGYFAAGLIAGEFDGVAPGVAPDHAAYIAALHDYGLSWTGTLHGLAHTVASFDTDRLLLFTPLVYYDESEPFDLDPRGDRALHALMWRILRATTPAFQSIDIVHVVPSGEGIGNDPLAANYQSPWALAAREGNLLDFAAQGGEVEAAKVRPLWTVYSPLLGIATPVPDVVIVGASTVQGTRWERSARPADVRAPGEEILSTCAMDCSGDGLSWGTGTDVAAAQVAGLAAYMWAVNPALDGSDLIRRLLHAYVVSGDPGFVDAYVAMLAVDDAIDIVNAPARRALLDVAGAELGSLDPNGVFDDVDLETYITFFRQYESERAVAGDNFMIDHSRFDLNGDGLTGGDGEGRFDLDATWPTAFTEISAPTETTPILVDETRLTDREILCYYAYSDLYAGDEARRNELLGGCDGPRVIHRNSSLTALVQANYFGDDGLESLLDRVQSRQEDAIYSGALVASAGGNLHETRTREDENGDVYRIFRWDMEAGIGASEVLTLDGSGGLQRFVASGNMSCDVLLTVEDVEARMGESNLARGHHSTSIGFRVAEPVNVRVSATGGGGASGQGRSEFQFNAPGLGSTPGTFEGVLEPGGYTISVTASAGSPAENGGGTANLNYSLVFEILD